MSDTRSFTCAMCGSVETVDQPLEEVEAEFRANFGDKCSMDDVASIRDDCYAVVMPALNN